MTNTKPPQETLAVDEVRSLLREARRICGTAKIVDMHVHATEVIRDKIQYQSTGDGLHSSEKSGAYRGPELANIRVLAGSPVPSTPLQNRISEMAFTRAYQHTGPQVLADQLALAGVDRAALLPVASDERDVATQMRIIRECCRADPSFIAGYSVPATVSDAAIEDDLGKAIERYGVRILKVHPNISGIDISAEAGRARLRAIIQACDRWQLPVLLHGGCSPILGDAPASKFSTIENLARIDWSMTRSPVIIAHFGIYGCNLRATAPCPDAETTLGRMLADNAHMYTDTSGVDYAAIEHMLGVVPARQLVFGSDALYVPMYRQLALVMHALTKRQAADDEVRTVLCENAATILSSPVAAD